MENLIGLTLESAREELKEINIKSFGNDTK